jgi:hypothetical protein
VKVCRCGQEGVEQFGGRLSRHWFVQELLGVRFCVDPSGVSGWVQGHALTLFGDNTATYLSLATVSNYWSAASSTL